MPHTTQPYAETIALLRSVSARHARILREMTACRPGGFEQVERLATDARSAEDEAIAAVCRLSVLTDRATADVAVEEAGASWLRDVILNRAAETARPGSAAGGR